MFSVGVKPVKAMKRSKIISNPDHELNSVRNINLGARQNGPTNFCEFVKATFWQQRLSLLPVKI